MCYHAHMKESSLISSLGPDPQQGEFAAFKALAAKLVRVPKAEVDAKEAAYQREQKKKPKRGPKTG